MKSPLVQQLQITRTFEAPASELFKWWAEPDKLQQWSGCNQCIGCEVAMDFRVGGGFRQKMKIAVNGRVCDFTVTGAYVEIVVPKLICYTLDMGQQITQVRVEFFEEAARTKVVLTQDGFDSPESSQIVSQGTNDSLDQLERLVSSPAAAVEHALKEPA